MRSLLPRWMLPAAGATMGAAALAVLLAGEALEPSTSPTRGAPPAATRPPAASAPAPAIEPVLVATPAPASPPLRVPDVPRAPQDPARRPVESPALLGVMGELNALTRQPDLPARLAWLDARLAALSPAGAARLLGGLVDAPLPGDGYEAESLRLAALARLGGLPGPEVDAILIARLDPERPRPERMVTLELLSARRDVGTRELEQLARADHDPVVREKALWALRVRGGRG